MMKFLILPYLIIPISASLPGDLFFECPFGCTISMFCATGSNGYKTCLPCAKIFDLSNPSPLWHQICSASLPASSVWDPADLPSPAIDARNGCPANFIVASDEKQATPPKYCLTCGAVCGDGPSPSCSALCPEFSYHVYEARNSTVEGPPPAHTSAGSNPVFNHSDTTKPTILSGPTTHTGTRMDGTESGNTTMLIGIVAGFVVFVVLLGIIGCIVVRACKCPCKIRPQKQPNDNDSKPGHLLADLEDTEMAVHD